MDTKIINVPKSDKFVNKYLDQLTKYIKNKNSSLTWLLPVIKIIKSNINFLLLVLFIGTLYCSNYFINLFQLFLLFDSIILSIIVLQSSKDKVISKRLAKNIISLFILTINIVGSLFSIILFFLIYFSFNGYVSKTIYKIIEMGINFLSTTLPFIKDLYPSINLIDHNKNFESTESISSDSEADSEADSESNYSIDSDSEELTNKKTKEYKFYKKLIKDLKSD